MKEKITVLLADDHSMVLQGLQELLKAESDIQVVGQAETGTEAVECATRLRPDVVVMDIAMPLLNGLEATRQIRLAVPETRVIILSAYGNQVCIDRAVALGVAGYLIKNASVRVLAQAIRQAAQGGFYFDPSIATPVAVGKPRPAALRGARQNLALSPRETEVLPLIADGLLNKQIADKLGISVKTAEKHRYNLMNKLEIHDTAGLTRYAVASGAAENGRSTVGAGG